MEGPAWLLLWPTIKWTSQQVSSFRVWGQAYYCDLLEVRFVNTQRAGMLDQIHRWGWTGPRLQCGENYLNLENSHRNTKHIDQDFCLNLNTHLSSHVIRPLNVTLDIPQEMVFILVFHEGKCISVVVRKRVVAASDRPIKQPSSSISPLNHCHQSLLRIQPARPFPVSWENSEWIICGNRVLNYPESITSEHQLPEAQCSRMGSISEAESV